MECDYLIVGAGTAGCVIASRLAELTNASIVVLESGNWAADGRLDDSRGWDDLLGTELFHCFDSVAQTRVLDKQFAVGHGRVIGGSGAVNALYHCWPSADDFDEWNLPGWRWDDILPSLLASETYLQASDGLRGRTGPVKVQQLPDPPPIADSFFAAAERLGVPHREDVNLHRTGAGLPQLTYHDGLRQHAGRSYLKDALSERSLQCVANAQVTGLVFDHHRVIGAEALVEGRKSQFFAGKEVILCAGALATPKLLMCAGIGPLEQLARYGIKPLVKSPDVGSNLQEHYMVMAHSFRTPSPIAQSGMHRSVATMYGSIGGDKRDCMINLFADGYLWEPLAGSDDGFMAAFGYTKPISRGTLALSSADPRDPPFVDMQFFKESQDFERLVDVFELSRAVLNGQEFKKFKGVEVNPGLDASSTDTRNFLYEAGVGFQHFCGTCRMGADDSAVVDTKLRVRGVDQLRIVDASVFPTIPSVPTNATAMAVAEHAATIIANEGSPADA